MIAKSQSELDVLAFEDDEALNTPFRHRVEFNSADHAISKEIMLIKSLSLTLQAPEPEVYLTLTAGNPLDVGAQKDFTLAAGKRLSLYSREGAKLFSSQNDIDIQAQGGDITTWSTQDTHISSGKKLVVTAQDELTLICGGGYIKIKGGNVEIGGPGKLLIKNTGIKKAGPGNMQGVMKSFKPSTFDEKFVIRNALTKEPIPGKAYKITMPDGSVVSGITDASGATSLNSSDVIDNMIISLVKAN